MGRQAWARGLGPAAARQVRRARRRHRDGLAVEQAAAAALGAGRGRAPGAARLPARRRGSRCSPRSQRSIEAAGGRVLTDHPAARLARAGDGGLVVHAGRGRLVPRGPRPARRSPPAAADERYDRVLATVPERRLRAAPRPRRWPPRWARSTSRRARGIEYFAALCLLLELDRRVLPVLLDQRRRPRAAVRRPHRAHELRRARALRRAPLPLRRQLPARTATSCSASTPTRCSRATRPGCARSTRRSRATGCRGRWRFTPSRPRSRSSPSATRDRIPPLRTPAAGLVLANTTQVYPEDRGTNYAVRLGEQAARRAARAASRPRSSAACRGGCVQCSSVGAGLLELVLVGAAASSSWTLNFTGPDIDRDVVGRGVARNSHLTFVPFAIESDAGLNAKSSTFTVRLAADAVDGSATATASGRQGIEPAGMMVHGETVLRGTGTEQTRSTASRIPSTQPGRRRLPRGAGAQRASPPAGADQHGAAAAPARSGARRATIAALAIPKIGTSSANGVTDGGRVALEHRRPDREPEQARSSADEQQRGHGRRRRCPRARRRSRPAPRTAARARAGGAAAPGSPRPAARAHPAAGRPA